MTYGRPDDAFRIGYLDTMWNAIHGELGKQGDIFRTLDDTISASIIKANTIHLIKQNSIL